VEKRPVADGAWLEIEAKDLLKRSAELDGAKLVVLTNVRLELDKEEATRLVAKMQERALSQKADLDKMDDEQKAFFLFRQILVGA